MNNLYNSLPVALQNMACTWAGYRRNRARYSRHFHRTLAAWQKSVDAPIEELHRIQWERLRTLVERARLHVPHYRDIAPPSEHRDPRIAIEETLAGIPSLDKHVYRASPQDFVARDIPPNRIHRVYTSGTTGTALLVNHTPEALAEEFAAVWRMRTARGVKLMDPNLTFNGNLIVPYSQADAPFWRTNAYGRQKLFSVYHMTARNLPRYIDAIHASRASYIEGYPSALHLVGRAMLDSGRPLEKGAMKAVFTSSESLLAFQRDTIEEAFGTRVWDRYGTGEFTVSMTACEENNLHVDMEFCVVEIEPEMETDEYVRGTLVVTGLSNDATAFIRYSIGDAGTKLKRPCVCGRPGDVFLAVDGRNEDFVVTPDGRFIGRLDHIFKTQSNILEAQIRQDSKEAIEVLFVPAEGFDEAAEKELIHEIRQRLGEEIHIDLVRVPSIPRERNGKFRAVRSKIGQMS